jgi:hypothetical protein
MFIVLKDYQQEDRFINVEQIAQIRKRLDLKGNGIYWIELSNGETISVSREEFMKVVNRQPRSFLENLGIVANSKF